MIIYVIKILMFFDFLEREIYLLVGINNNCKCNVLYVYINKDSIENMYVFDNM